MAQFFIEPHCFWHEHGQPREMTWEVPADIDPFNTTSRRLFGSLVEMSYFQLFGNTNMAEKCRGTILVPRASVSVGFLVGEGELVVTALNE